MRPSLSGRSHSLYSAAAALYRSATALYRSSTAICRYAGSTAGFVHILGPHLSTVLGALLPLHYSSIAAPLRRRPRVQIRPFCPRRRPNRSSRVQIMGFCPRRRPLVLFRTAARARSAQGASQFAAGYAAVRLTHHSDVFAPVDFQIVHQVCKTGLFAHVIFLFERHPKSWIELTQGMGD